MINSQNAQLTLNQSIEEQYLTEFKKVSLKNVFSKIQNHLYANSSISRNERLGAEVIKIILAKHFDEKWNSGIFSANKYKNYGDQFPNTLKEFYKKKVLPVLLEDGIFTDKDNLSLDDKSLIYIGLELCDKQFSESPIDSLGAAFEIFAEGKLAGDQGQFFTPFFMVKLCVEILKPKTDMLILDPACGSGGFLNYTIRWLNSQKSNGGLKDFIKNNLLGIDKDLDLAKIGKSFALFMDGNPNNIYNLDSLKLLSNDERLKEHTFRNKFFNKIDMILTNPPFGTKIKIKDQEILKNYDLGHEWKLNKKNNKWIKTRNIQETEPQILFIELCIKLLKEGGKLAIVLPEGIFGNPSQGYVRDYILSKGKLLAVIDCPHDAFMPHTHTKTSILFFEKKTQKDYEIFMGRVNDCGHDSRGAILIDNDGQIKEDFTQMIAKYTDYLNNNLKEDKNNYIIKQSELTENIFVPNYYDYELLSHLKHNANHKAYELVSLGELEKQGQISIRNVPASTSKHNYGSGEIPFIRTTDIANGEIIYPTIHAVSKEIFERYKNKQGLKEFDILFVKDGTYRIGNSVILFKNDLKSIVQSHFKIIRVEKQDMVTPALLFYLLQQDVVKRQISNNTFTQATLSSIGNRIYNIKIPFPKDKKEREKLSNFAFDILTKRNECKLKLFNSKITLNSAA